MTDIVAFPCRQAAADAITADDAFFALRRDYADPCAVLLMALTSGRFSTLPRLAIRAIKIRHSEPIGDTHIAGIDGVDLYCDSAILYGHEVLIVPAPHPIDARSALRNALIAEPAITKKAALQRVRQVAWISELAFLRDWPIARRDAGLSERGRSGRPRKSGLPRIAK